MRFALGIEYNGHAFYGWQEQQHVATVQGSLQNALTKIANHPVQVFCAGRTDAGVHSMGQVVHFDTASERTEYAWVRGTNTYLPPSISIRWIKPVDLHFHARFSAIYRRYRYIIDSSKTRPALFNGLVTWHPHHLEAALMHEAAQFLLGEQDFSSFRSAQCESTTPMRNVHEIKVLRKNHLIIIEIQANAFLHHMVRNIVGVLLKIGEKKAEPDWVKTVLYAKNRTVAAETAPPTGLYLMKVGYPDEFCLPEAQNTHDMGLIY